MNQDEADQSRRHAAYREAKAAVPAHRRVQADAELERAAWLKRHRGVPAHVLYDRNTGEPVDNELAALESAVSAAVADVRWCQAVQAACAVEIKGEALEAILARNDEHRATTRERMRAALGSVG